MYKTFAKISIETDHPHPVTSPDYQNPAGSIEDNSTCPYFIWELDTYFQGHPYRLLDFGCAGGQFVVDINNKGYPWTAVGIEGGNIHGMHVDFDNEIETSAGILSRARGYKNWKEYRGKCLFNADLSKPFDIFLHGLEDPFGQHQIYKYPLPEGKIPFKFDIVTSFEFLEHPHPDEVDEIIKNMNKHLKMGGVVLGTINLTPGEHHRCVKTRQEWTETFKKHGFYTPETNNSQWTILRNGRAGNMYPFRATPRTNAPHLLADAIPFQGLDYYKELIQQGKFKLDQELYVGERLDELVFPYFFVKDKECD